MLCAAFAVFTRHWPLAAAFALAVSPEPIFTGWNLRLMRGLFHFLPHTGMRDTVAQFLVDNALASTWIFAATFYAYWRIRDERTVWRRSRLIALAFALGAVAGVTLALRPWIGWPAPVLAARFRTLYPDYLWSDGNPNCFPSHSTFIYMLIALGCWPFNRKLCGLLVLCTLALISFPRVYVGGHYPIDILAGAILAAFAMWLASAICKLAPAREAMERLASAGLWVEVLLFLWLFELADGFRSSFWLLTVAARAGRNLI